MIGTTQKSELSLDNSTTHYITGRMEIPGVGITKDAPDGVKFGENDVPKSEMKKVGAAWYYDFVFGLKEGSNGEAVLSSGATNFTLSANGITTTVTPDLSGIELA